MGALGHSPTVAADPPEAETVVSPARFPHLPALDGLRGVAVALVVAYHLEPDVVPGGFLGVDVFFVLSGFLITSLLVDEVRGTGRIGLRTFYLRRLRRLAPALLLVIAALSAYAAMSATATELSRIRRHALWTLGYLANWRFVADGTTYTDVVAGESPLRHAWSLAIEEQFYVVFPFLALVLVRIVRRDADRLRRALLWVAASGSAASAVWMAVLWGDGADPWRGYFGTDTRAHSLLVGVGLGALLVGRPPRVGRAARVAGVAGPIGVIVVAGAVAVAREDAAWLQRGGFLVVALAVAGVIAALERCGWLRRALSVRPLVALGVISYGLYLWHWPVIVLLDESRAGVEGPALAALQLVLSLAAATASYWVLERPVRRGALGRRLGPVAVLSAPLATAAVVVAVVAATTVPGPATGPVEATPPVTAGPPPTTPAGHPVLDVVILGDSVAHTIAGGTVGDSFDFERWAPEQSPFDPARARAWSVAKPACSFLPGRVTLDGGPGADLSPFCEGWRQDLAATLDARPGAVVVVALANDATDRRLDDEVVALGTPEHDAMVASLLDEVRGIATDHGGSMALVALPPRTGRAATELDVDGRRDRLLREALRAYVGAHPEVPLLDLFEEICPAGDCDRPRGGFEASWRYDGLHFTREGATWVAAWIVDRLSPVSAVR